jgi:hypothetical protein
MQSPQLPVPLARSYWVFPGLFLAGEHPGDFDDVSTAARLLALLNAGIRTFLDLTIEEEPPLYGRLLRRLEQERAYDLTIVRIGLRDMSVPSVLTTKRALDVIDGAIKDKSPIYIHCWAGLGRTGTLVGCYLQRHGISTSENVLEKIAELRRPMSGNFDRSPQTEEQIARVQQWMKGE